MNKQQKNHQSKPQGSLQEHLASLAPIRFDQFMHLALYHPKWGYYSTNNKIFGAKGDFITAPELTPLFGQTLAQALNPSIKNGLNQLYEFGAGQGKLAHHLLTYLDNSIKSYTIIEVSACLKKQQESYLKKQLPEYAFSKINWATTLPEKLQGIVIGNEVLDAMPVRRFRWHNAQIEEAYVITHLDKTSDMFFKACDDSQTKYIQAMEEKFGPWPSGYTTESAEQVKAFVNTITEKLEGICLMIDYGMDAHSYYHPKNAQGHLRAHSKHTAHDNFLVNPGQQDLTCHVNFSEVFEALQSQGGQLEGYVSQAAFLLHNGLLELAERHTSLTDPKAGLKTRQALHTLTSESDMGFNFKTMIWSKKYDLTDSQQIDCFIKNDLSHTL